MFICKWCDWRISDTEYFAAAGDYPCPRCDAPLSSFIDVSEVEQSDDSEILDETI